MNRELDFYKDFTFDEFCSTYFPMLVMLVQKTNIPKNEIKVIITKIIKTQTPITKENLMKEMPKRDTDRKLVNWVVRNVELYQKVESCR